MVRHQLYMVAAAVALMTGAANAGEPHGTLTAHVATNPSAGGARVSDGAPAQTGPAASRGVFPFPAGIYSTGGCDPDEGGLVEFMKEGFHEWEAGQGTSFLVVRQIAPDSWMITERFNSDEGGDLPEEVRYDRTGPRSFTRTQGHSYDDRGNRLDRPETRSFRYCRALDPS